MAADQLMSTCCPAALMLYPSVTVFLHCCKHNLKRHCGSQYVAFYGGLDQETTESSVMTHAVTG